MYDAPFTAPGTFWRGNLHTHSNRSDGTLAPQHVVDHYRDAGYDFIAITDHFRADYGYPITDTRALRTAGFTTLIGAELHGPRTELSDEWHIIALGIPVDFAPPHPGEHATALAQRARSRGAFIGMAHPAASLLTLADAESLTAAHAVEIHNELAALEHRADSTHLYDLLLARGHRLSAYAADDAHFQAGTPRAAAAWVQVKAESLDPDDLLEALKQGRYYSSTGPTIHDIRIGAHTVLVRCSPAQKVVLTSSAPGLELVQGNCLTECEVPLGKFANAPFIRITVEDATGGRAWSNPLAVPDFPLTAGQGSTT
jgi:predicted metal-dependent phosphoesterase TrpH